MKRVICLLALVGLLTLPALAGTTQFLYANNATFGSPYIYQIDPSTGNVVQTFTGLEGGNGRGVIDVNNILYYTTAFSGDVYYYNTATHANGILFDVTGASGLASITYDGTNFWIGDYSGTNKAFLYAPNGTLLKTITLSNCTGFCDGLTFFKQNGTGYLLSNRVDGCCGGTPVQYDVYDTNGNLIKSAFISSPNPSTGVAWDGTNFWTSDVFNGTVTEWDANSNFIQTVTLSGYPSGFSPLIEGMSFNFAQTIGGGSTPEPASLILLGSGLLGLGGVARRKFRS